MNAKVRTYQDDLEEHFLIDLHKLLVPIINVGGLLAGVGIVIVDGNGVILVPGAPFNDLLEDLIVDLKFGL